jgi:hypothetical protein
VQEAGEQGALSKGEEAERLPVKRLSRGVQLFGLSYQPCLIRICLGAACRVLILFTNTAKPSIFVRVPTRIKPMFFATNPALKPNATAKNN